MKQLINHDNSDTADKRKKSGPSLTQSSYDDPESDNWILFVCMFLHIYLLLFNGSITHYHTMEL